MNQGKKRQHKFRSTLEKCDKQWKPNTLIFAEEIDSSTAFTMQELERNLGY